MGETSREHRSLADRVDAAGLLAGHVSGPSLEILRAEIQQGGRRLAGPLLCRRRVGLPEWLAEGCASGKGPDWVPATGGAAGSAPRGASSRRSDRLAVAGLPSSSAPLAEAEPTASEPDIAPLEAGTHDASPSSGATGSKQSPLPKLPLSARPPRALDLPPEEEPVSLTSRTLSSRRKQHSRLRWPRLAAVPPSRRSGVDSSLPPLGAHRGSHSEDDSEMQQGGELQPPPFEGFGPIVFDPGSVFYHPNSERMTFNWPTPQAHQDGRRRVAEGPSADGKKKPGRERSQRDGDGESSSIFVSRMDAYQDVLVGAAVTERPAMSQRPGAAEQAEPDSHVPTMDRGNRWQSRQAPVSTVMASRARLKAKKKSDAPPARVGRSRRKSVLALQEAGKVSGPLLDFTEWGLDDDYMISLLSAMGKQDLATIENINLSENRLTRRSAEWLLKACPMLGRLKALNLSHNMLRAPGGMIIAQMVKRVSKFLTELELGGNQIGDRACVELCSALASSIPPLTHLGLAGNGLGTTDSAGEAIGSLVVQGLRTLQSLDLHWNRLCGNGATWLCRSIYDNNCTLGGDLRRLDLSWNMLGEDTGGGSTRVAKVLSSVFIDGNVLFHVDLSYNSFSSSDCKILADGLRCNFTLFGIHMMGNEAYVDDQGFIVPRQISVPPSEASKESLQHQVSEEDTKQQIVINELVRHVPGTFDIMAEAGAPPRQPLCARKCAAWAGVERDVGCCWLCSNWVDQEVSYIPGWSGPEAHPDDVTSIFAFFSIDNFARATPLSRTEEPFSKSLFGALDLGNGRMSPKRSVKRTAAGRVVRWAARRMLPPTALAVEVIFQVNDKFVVARDLPKKDVPAPKNLTLAGTPAPAPASPDVGDDAAGGRRAVVDALQGSSRKPPGGKTTDMTVNFLTPAFTALSNFRHGVGNPLLSLEDPSRRGEASVLPRKILEHGERVEVEAWSFEKSIFAGFTRDTPELTGKCFDHDWALSKLPQFVKSVPAIAALSDVLRPHYLQLVTAFSRGSLQNYSSSRAAAGLGMQELKDILGMCDPSGTWLLGVVPSCRVADVDTIFVVSNVMRKEKPPIALKALPERSLARFQFLEAFVRVAARRFFDSGEKPDHAAAASELLERSGIGLEWLEQRQALQGYLFCEECDLLYRETSGLLEAVYEIYKRKLCYPGRNEQGLTFGAWQLLCSDTELVDTAGITNRKVAIAFALGRQHHVQDVESFRHMELSVHEFFVALGGIVMLRNDFEPTSFSDMLTDLFTENIAEALRKASVGGGGDSSLRMRMMDPDVKPVLDFVLGIFQSADSNSSGTIGGHEFYCAFKQPGVLKELANLGIHVQDVDALYRQIDSDGSGEVTLDELCQAFANLRLQMKGMERAVAYFRNIFSRADKNNSGALDLREFKVMLSEPGALEKLETLGIVTDEVDNLFREVLSESEKRKSDAGDEDEGADEVTADQLVAAFLRLRDPGLQGERATAYLHRIFLEADVDGDGELTRAEIKSKLYADKVTSTIKQFGLTVPDWLAIHEQLDTNGDGVLSWDELKEGTTALWAAEVDKRVQSQATSFVDVGPIRRLGSKRSATLNLGT